MDEFTKIVYSSKRRSVSLHIDDFGFITLKVPNKASTRYALRLLRSDDKKVLQLKQEAEKRRTFWNIHRISQSGGVFFFGDKLRVTFDGGVKRPRLQENLELPTGLDGERIVKHITNLLKKEAKVYFDQRIGELAEQCNLPFEGWRLSGARGRWGSCSSLNNINLVWRLIMAPSRISDYVILHELAHTKHKNHSRKFWRLVEEWDPEYKQHRCWLKENGWKLNVVW